MPRVRAFQAWWLRGWRARLAGPLVAALSLMAPPLQAAVLVVTNLNDSGPGSLRQTIADAASGDTIVFSVTGTLVLTGGELWIDKDLTIDGPGTGPNLLTISGNDSSSVFFIDDAVVVAIQDLGIRHGRSGNQGGGVTNRGGLTLANCAVSDNTVFLLNIAWGGAIYTAGGTTLTIENCTLSGNDSLQDGGAIFNDSGTVTISNSTLSNNFALGHGGAIFNHSGATLTISSSTLSGNGNEYGNGGAIFNETGSSLSISNASAVSNNSSNDGGGIFNDGALTMLDTTLSGNYGSNGGGIFNDGALTMSGCELLSNSAYFDGAGIFSSSTLTMSDSTVSGNSGVGLHNDGFGTLLDSSIASNSSRGVLNQGTLTMSNTAVVGNNFGINGDQYGGGITNGGTLRMSNCTISGNLADIGGGIWNAGGSVTMSNCTISANIAVSFGGGIENTGPFISKSSIVGDNIGFANCAEPVTPVGVNFATDNTCGLPVVTSAQLNLGPLANYGGATQTHALFTGSVAVDATSDCTDAFGNPVTIDQRGMPRPQDGDGNQVADCDVGAFEASELVLFGAFDADVMLSKGSQRSNHFSSRGSFRLDRASDGIDPALEPVVLFLADRDGKFFEQTLRPGSFQRSEDGRFLFRAPDGSSGIGSMLITAAGLPGEFDFELRGAAGEISRAGQPPVIVSLQIGDDTGADTLPCANLPEALSCR